MSVSMRCHLGDRGMAERPTYVVDFSLGAILISGDYEVVLQSYLNLIQQFKDRGLTELLDDLELIELPADQVLVDAIFRNTGVLFQYLKSK